MAYIYAFYFKDSPDLFYIGKTINLPAKRFSSHIRDMKNGVHHSKKVQDLYNLYEEEPILEILEECSYNDVDILEIFYIKEFNSVSNGLNMVHPEGGTEHPASKYAQRQILAVFSMLVKGIYSYNEIYTRTKVSIGSIKGIRRGTLHSWIAEDYTEKWNKLKTTAHKVIAVTSLKNQNKPSASFISPQGVEYRDIRNLKDFVYSLNFDNPSSAYKMFSAMYNKSSKARSYKGWKALY